MDKRIRLRELIWKRNLQGETKDNKDLAPILFPSKSNSSSQVIFYKKKSGETTKIDREDVFRICRRLESNPCELFGWPDDSFILPEDKE